jgi:hypothetical protein
MCISWYENKQLRRDVIREGGGIAACILNRDIRWTWVVIPLSLKGIEPHFLGHKARSLITKPAVLSRLLSAEGAML